LREKTIVVVWSDHGFHLGDQERWAKWTQFETDMRSPLMIRVPKAAHGGLSTHALVESVDVYPTLAAACGLPQPKHLEGVRLLPIISGEADSLKPAAYSQVKGLKGSHAPFTSWPRTPLPLRRRGERPARNGRFQKVMRAYGI